MTTDRRPSLHERICKAHGCAELIRAQGRASGLCTSHYQEHLKASMAAATGNIERSGPCLAGDCQFPRRSRGLCANHYAASRRRSTCPACGGQKDNRAGLCSACHKAVIAAQMPTQKICRECKRTLSVDSFDLRKGQDGAARWLSRCRDCSAAEARLRAKNAQRDRTKEQATASYSTLRGYAKKLGIPWAEVVERYPADNRCEVCGRTPQEATPTGRNARLSLDHCHESGRLRGFLCAPCNSGVGHLGDTPERLRAALKYLTAFEAIRILGPVCDPDYRTPDPDHHIDQDALPGL